MEENKKKKIIVAIIGVLALLVVVGSATYAFFSATDTEEERQITTAKEELVVEIPEGVTHIENIKPTNDFIVYSNYCNDWISECSTNTNKDNRDVVTIPINVTNKSTIDINYNLTLRARNLKLNEDITLEGGTTEDIKWVLYKLNNKDGYSNDPESYGDFYDVNFVNKMMTDVSISPNETNYYILFIYIQETNSNQNKLQNISFDVEISGNTKSLDIVGKKLADVILDNSVIKNREPNYNLVEYMDEDGDKRLELQDTGLFKLNDTNIYYNRGPVYFNRRVYFGTHKSGDLATLPIYWKILRVNEDKSITLIYDASRPLSGNYNSSGKSDYIGSEAEQFLKKWYENTFSDKEKALIQETTFCNDKSDNYEGAKNRLTKDKPTPTLDCREEDKVKAKIGLVTADELVYMGTVYSEDNTSSEIYNRYGYGYGGLLSFAGFISSINTMTPSSENTIFYTDGGAKFISSDGKTNYTSSYVSLSPVITLSKDAIISKQMSSGNRVIKSDRTSYIINPNE